jgi:hypothetical protein
MAEHSSSLYARNVSSLLELLVGEDGALNLNFDDEIIAGACITRDGKIVHEGAKKAVEAAEGKGEPPSPAELAPTPEGEEEAEPDAPAAAKGEPAPAEAEAEAAPAEAAEPESGSEPEEEPEK